LFSAYIPIFDEFQLFFKQSGGSATDFPNQSLSESVPETFLVCYAAECVSYVGGTICHSKIATGQLRRLSADTVL